MALLSHRSVDEAAQAVGIAPRTLYRWLTNADFQKAYREAKRAAFAVDCAAAEFQKEYREAKRAAFAQSTARLHQMSSAAVSTLAKVMVDASSPATTRVRAAEIILNHSTKALEIEDIEARLTVLEETAPKAGKR